MTEDGEMRRLMEASLHELDRSFGRYVSGAVIAGNTVPSYKDVMDREDPLRLTQRVLVEPVMSVLGYDTVLFRDVFDGKVPGISMAVVSMNSVLSSASSCMVTAMNADHAPKGIATDGFRWILAMRSEDVVRVCAV